MVTCSLSLIIWGLKIHLTPYEATPTTLHHKLEVNLCKNPDGFKGDDRERGREREAMTYHAHPHLCHHPSSSSSSCLYVCDVPSDIHGWPHQNPQISEPRGEKWEATLLQIPIQLTGKNIITTCRVCPISIYCSMESTAVKSHQHHQMLSIHIMGKKYSAKQFHPFHHIDRSFETKWSRASLLIKWFPNPWWLKIQ